MASKDGKSRPKIKLKAEELTISSCTCPICLSIFIEPVTFPCGHELCNPCFRKHVEQTSLACPFCRLRISVWVRRSTKTKSLVNQERWEAIQQAFPDRVRNRLEGREEEEEDQEDEIYQGPLSLAEPGEIKQEFEAELEKVRESYEDTQEVRLSMDLIQQLEAREKEQRLHAERQAQQDEELARRLQQELDQAKVQSPLIKKKDLRSAPKEKNTFLDKFLKQEGSTKKKVTHNEVEMIEFSIDLSPKTSDQVGPMHRFLSPKLPSLPDELSFLPSDLETTPKMKAKHVDKRNISSSPMDCWLKAKRQVSKNDDCVEPIESKTCGLSGDTKCVDDKIIMNCNKEARQSGKDTKVCLTVGPINVNSKSVAQNEHVSAVYQTKLHEAETVEHGNVKCDLPVAAMYSTSDSLVSDTMDSFEKDKGRHTKFPLNVQTPPRRSPRKHRVKKKLDQPTFDDVTENIYLPEDTQYESKAILELDTTTDSDHPYGLSTIVDCKVKDITYEHSLVPATPDVSEEKKSSAGERPRRLSKIEDCKVKDITLENSHLPASLNASAPHMSPAKSGKGDNDSVFGSPSALEEKKTSARGRPRKKCKRRNSIIESSSEDSEYESPLKRIRRPLKNVHYFESETGSEMESDKCESPKMQIKKGKSVVNKTCSMQSILHYFNKSSPTRCETPSLTQKENKGTSVGRSAFKVEYSPTADGKKKKIRWPRTKRTPGKEIIKTASPTDKNNEFHDTKPDDVSRTNKESQEAESHNFTSDTEYKQYLEEEDMKLALKLQADFNLEAKFSLNGIRSRGSEDEYHLRQRSKTSS